MSQTAICLETAKVLDLSEILSERPEDAVIQDFHSRKFSCIHCLRELHYQRTGLRPSDEEILAGIDPATLPANKTFRRSCTYHKQTREEPVHSPSAFVHLPGTGDGKRCDSPESRHHAFCYELAKGKRGMLFNGSIPQRLVTTTMARYIKDPSHREPDISFLIAESDAIAHELQKEIDMGGHRTLDFDGYTGLLAAEVQLSPLKVPEYIERTQDHRKRFLDVAWIFHENFLANVRPVRIHMHQNGVIPWVIREERGGIFWLEKLPYKERGPSTKASKPKDYCMSAFMMLAAQFCPNSLEGQRALAEAWEVQMKDTGVVETGIPGIIFYG